MSSFEFMTLFNHSAHASAELTPEAPLSHDLMQSLISRQDMQAYKRLADTYRSVTLSNVAPPNETLGTLEQHVTKLNVLFCHDDGTKYGNRSRACI